MSHHWLLVSVTTAGSSSELSLYAWRRLRSLGARYLQNSVCLLPNRPAPAKEAADVADRVRTKGGQARVFPIELADPDHDAAMTAAFSAERTEEYRAVVARTADFLADIERGRDRGPATYPEVEESEADLKRLERWLASIRERDYFDAAGYADALTAVNGCARALAEFQAEAFENEQRGSEVDPGRALWRGRLGDVGGAAGR
jgi:hypothetical protein